jgi:hypothetical protein
MGGRLLASTRAGETLVVLSTTDDTDFPDFKPAIDQWRVEYGRIRKLGGGNDWLGHTGWKKPQLVLRCPRMRLALAIIAQCER